MRLALVAALLLSLPAFAFGRIAGTVGFKGRAPRPEKIKPADPECVAFELSGREVLVRITKNAPARVVASELVVLETSGCVSRPFLQGATKGQKLLLKNADSIPHALHALLGTRTLFEVVQPAGARPLEKELRGEVVKIICDLHPSVRSYVLISDFFAVTGPDGTFEIQEVPPGHYTVEAWSERLGTLSAEVTVVEGESVDPKFNFTGR